MKNARNQTLHSASIKSFEQLGSAIRRFRKLQNMSQGELAQKAGTTQKTISKLESNGEKTTIGILLLVLAALKLDLTLNERNNNSVDEFEGLF